MADIVCGGFPCQSVSVAGKRAGLADRKRSGLFYEMTRTVDEIQPRFLVWENVPGLLSSDGGRDFARVLMELDRIGFHGAWTVLDAQWFGVPQRRRRVFGVFARRDIGAERCAEILSFAARSSGHSPPRRQAGTGVAGTVAGGARKSGGYWRAGNPTLSASDDNRTNHVIAAPLTSGQAASAGVNRPGRRREDDENLVAYTVHSANSCAQERHAFETERAKSLDSTGGFASGQGGTLVAHALRSEGADASEDGTGRGTPLVWESTFVLRALRASEDGVRTDCRPMLGVRRPMPLECLRLQSLPDSWLDLYPPLSDSAKYRLIGNSVVVNVVEWIAKRIVAQAQ